MNRRSLLVAAAALAGGAMSIFTPSASAQTRGQLPPAHENIPLAGQKAPDFTLPDSNGKPMKLSELLAPPAGAKDGAAEAPWVLLIFYRGYW